MNKKHHNAVEESTRQFPTSELLAKLNTEIGGSIQVGFTGYDDQLQVVNEYGQDLTWGEITALIVALERTLDYRMDKSGWKKWLSKYSSQLHYAKIKESKEGFVYVMRNNRSGYCKIGFSETPQFRERTLQAQEPDVEMLFSFNGTMNTEAELHRKYATKRLRGEWFNLSEKEIEAIRAYHCR